MVNLLVILDFVISRHICGMTQRVASCAMKVCMIGPQSSGKTTFATVLRANGRTGGMNLDYVSPTIGVDTFVCNYGDHQIILWDIAGAGPYPRSLVDEYYRQCDLFLLLFGMDQAAEDVDLCLETLKWFKNRVNRLNPDADMIAIANKLDLCPEWQPDARFCSLSIFRRLYLTTALEPETILNVWEVVRKTLRM